MLTLGIAGAEYIEEISDSCLNFIIHEELGRICNGYQYTSRAIVRDN